MINSNQILLSEIAALFQSAKATLGVVESCTGGSLSAALTFLPGSSAWFEGAVIAYSNQVKNKSVYVRQSTLDAHGAVSEECVKEMANGGMVALNVDCCLSVSGIAGPDGASPGKPVGTVWFGLAVRHKSIQAFEYHFTGDREAVRNRAVQEGLAILSSVSLKKAV